MKKSIVGKILNTLEHALPPPLKDVFYFLSCKLPEPFHSNECWLCRGEIKSEVINDAKTA